MKRFFCLIVSLLFFTSALFCEIRYIEIDSIKNVPVIEIKTVEDFESIIGEYGVRIGYLQKNNSTLFIIADSVYFSFALNGYYSLSDYKTGKAKKFKNGDDFNDAISLGFDSSETYYYYKTNSFNSVEDCKDAYKNDFVGVTKDFALYKYSSDSSVYYAAKKEGYTKYSDFKEYVDITNNGFKTKEDWLDAKSKKFENGKDYYIATENGFSNYKDFNSAQMIGITTNDDYQEYLQIKDSIEKIMKEKNLEKNNAVIYFYIQKLPKGDKALSALTNSLNENYSSQKKEISTALNLWYSDISNIEDTKNQGRNDYGYNQKRLYEIKTLFTTATLSDFLKTNDISALGTYNEKTEIFRKK